MNGLPWYKACPKDFFEGTAKLPWDVTCVYRVVLDLLYYHGGRLPDDDRYIAGALKMSIRRWRKYREILLSEPGKLNAGGGYLSNFRVDEEVYHAREMQAKNAENASKRWRKSLEKGAVSPENNGLADATAMPIKKHKRAHARVASTVPESPNVIAFGGRGDGAGEGE